MSTSLGSFMPEPYTPAQQAFVSYGMPLLLLVLAYFAFKGMTK